MIPQFLRPAFPDAGRIAVQRPHFEALTSGHPLRGRVLNAGSGEGALSLWLESFAGITRIDNVDVCQPSAVIESHHDSRHHDHVASLTALPFDDATFDAVVCTEVIEHIEADALAVSELARVLKPGGLLIASVPLIGAPFDPAHAREGYAVETFTTLLARAGIVVDAHRTCCHLLLRGVMHYWRSPLIRLGANRTPYIPSLVMRTLAAADRLLRVGRPWDVIVRAHRA